MKDIFDFINDEDVEKKLKKLMYREIPMEFIIEESFINGRRLPGYGIYYNFFDYMINMGFSFKGVYNIYKEDLNLYTPNKQTVSETIAFKDLNKINSVVFYYLI